MTFMFATTPALNCFKTYSVDVLTLAPLATTVGYLALYELQHVQLQEGMLNFEDSFQNRLRPPQVCQ
jgi:hypothetical protein